MVSDGAPFAHPACRVVGCVSCNTFSHFRQTSGEALRVGAPFRSARGAGGGGGGGGGDSKRGHFLCFSMHASMHVSNGDLVHRAVVRSGQQRRHRRRRKSSSFLRTRLPSDATRVSNDSHAGAKITRRANLAPKRLLGEDRRVWQCPGILPTYCPPR